MSGDRSLRSMAAWPGWTAMVLCAFFLVAGCGKKDAPPSESPDAKGFSFFEVGADTVLTDRVRARLRDRLGRAGVSRRNVLDLELHFDGFLARHLPELDELHRRLNGASGARVEHDTVRLDFRHVDPERSPFDRVEMIFDDETGKPLLVRVHTRREGETVPAALRDAYGEPRIVELSSIPTVEDCRIWTRNGNALVFSATVSRSGIRGYGIVIYYGNALREMAEREEARRAAARDRKRDIIDRAF